MYEPLPSTPEHEVDLTLRRRLAWGLVAGLGLEELARREGVSRAELEQVLGSPGMILVLWVWNTFFREHDLGGFPGLLRVGAWALALISKHARERAVGTGVGYAFICTFALRAALKPTLRALSGQIETVLGRAPERRPGGLRAKLVDILGWAIETALTQHVFDTLGPDHVWAQDEAFQRSVARGEFGHSLAEYVRGAEAAAEPVTGDGAAIAETVAEPELRMLSAVDTTRIVSLPLQEPGRRDLLHERSRRKRCSKPPSVRLRPIGMAA